MFSKKGVSLITVLLFMLVATIAATATFKWLTSENKSSASRMEIQEASQSAAAGIRSVRAWMTNNANEVGAVVRQYILGGKRPISLNSRVNVLSNGKQNYNVWLAGISENNGAYKFKVVSEGLSRQNSKYTETAILNVSGLYQVTPPEEPPKEKKLDFDYSYFGSSVRNHGKVKVSSMLINGDWHGNPNTVDRNIVITGRARLSGDEINILGTGCIGGDLYADNGIEAKNLYVHGTSHQFGTKNEDSKLGVSNHAYFDGIVEHSENGDKKIYVGGNLTVKNLFKTHMGSGSSPVTIDGNLCVDSTTSQIQLGASQKAPAFVYNWTPSYNVPFTVRKNVYVTHPRAFYARSGDFSDNYSKLILGDSSSSKLYIPDAYHSSNYTGLRASFPDAFVDVSSDENKYYFYVYPSDPSSVKAGTNYEYGDDNVKKTSPYCSASDSCHVTPWFFSRASSENLFQRVPSEPFDFVRDVDCADSVKKVCDALWTKKKGCDNAEYKVDDILVTAYKKFHSYADSGCAKNITSMDDKQFVKKMNECYSTTKSDAQKRKSHFYNDYLVVKVEANDKNDFNEKDPANGYCIGELCVNVLRGKFIIIITNKPSAGEMNLPPTDSIGNNFVFLYLTQGTGSSTSIKGIDYQRYNYFIYTKDSVGSSGVGSNFQGQPHIEPTGGFLFGHADFHGSIYAAAENCAKVSSITNARPMVFNQELLDDLKDHKVICPTGADGYTEDNCGGSATSSSSSAAPTSSASGDGLIGGKDPYFVSIAPQLNVSLESQYKSMESTPAEVNDTNKIAGSIIVMPRIVYLSKTPKGKLTDYISVLTLNAANKSDREDKTKGTISNCDAIPTSGRLNAGGELAAGNYKCIYNPQKSYNPVPFYVVVSDEVGEQPTVNFKETSSETIRSNETTLVKVRIDGTSNTEPIKFHYSIDEAVLEYSGWNISTASSDLSGVKVTQRDSSSGHRLYFTVEVSPNTETQEVPILKLTTGDDPAYGDLYIDLIPPTENCLIGTITEHHIMVRGRAYINRASLSDYCSRSDVDCENITWGNTTLAEMNSRSECVGYGNLEWVTAQCRSRKVVIGNESWSCLTDDPISLVKVNGNAIPAYCEAAVIPSGENNKIENAVGGNTYNLYASLKWRKVKLTIKAKNANELSGSFSVRSLTGSYDCDESEIKSAEGCQRYVNAGGATPFWLNAEGDFQKYFRGWKCSPDSSVNNCSSAELIPNQGYKIAPYGPHTITVDFSPESHCYYDDFDDEYTEFKSTTTAFCASDVTTCVDTCNVAPGNSDACMPKFGKQLESNWLMTYHNKGSGENATYVAPVIDLDKGYIYASPNQDKPSILLRNKPVGHNGTMFALVQTGVISQSDMTDFLNSGLIFRSDGNKHLVLNIYGANKGNVTLLRFRVCRVNGQSVGSVVKDCQAIAQQSKPLEITNNSFIKVKLVVENSSLKVTAKVDENSWEGEANIGYNDASYTYVGLSLADPDFRVYDNGWTSSALDDACPAWEVPTVSCYFDDKVPLQETVTPFVTLSTTWFEDRNCVKKFYYNGCDNRTSDQAGCDRPGEIGLELNNDAGEYFFEKEGKHGVLNNDNKRTKSAFVKMVCPGNVSSLDLAQDYHCGEFTVGDPTYCIKDVEILKRTEHYSIHSGENEFSIENEDDKNLLGAVLHVNINNGVGPLHQNKVLGANITVQLEDENGVRSLSRAIATAGDETISMDWITANTIEFDPQHVSKVIIISDADITVDALHIHTNCSNKLDLKCERATLDLASNEWKIKVNPQPHEVTCSYTSDDSFLNNPEEHRDVSCDEHPMAYADGHEFDWVFKGDNPTKFTVKATKKSAAGKILAEATCTVEGTRSVNSDLHCGIVGGTEGETKTISYGSSAPGFWFRFGNNSVPGSKNVPYTVTLPSGSAENSTQKSGDASIGSTQNILDITDLEPSVGLYSYSVVINAGDNPSCNASFRVSTTNTSCSVDDQGKFTVNIGNPDKVYYSYKLVATDFLNNPLKSSDGSSYDEESLSLQYTPIRNGKYYYFVYVNDKIACKDSVTFTSLFSVTCPNDILSQNPQDPIVLQDYGADPCGTEGCSYEIFDIADEVSRAFSENSFNDVSANGEKSYRLRAQNPDGKKDSCTFKVSFVKPDIKLSCPADIADQDPGSAISVTEASVQNCDPCTFKVLLGNSEKTSGSDINSLSFTETAANATGEKTYTVKAIDKNDNTRSNSCTFTVAFKSSTSNEIVQEIDNNNFPSQEAASSGNCFTLKGKWTNGGWSAPLVFRCNANGSITIKYGSLSATDVNYVMLDLKTQTYYTESVVTFISNVCVTSDGANLRCGFGNK